jgi:hypothetical protein
VAAKVATGQRSTSPNKWLTSSPDKISSRQVPAVQVWKSHTDTLATRGSTRARATATPRCPVRTSWTRQRLHATVTGTARAEDGERDVWSEALGDDSSLRRRRSAAAVIAGEADVQEEIGEANQQQKSADNDEETDGEPHGTSARVPDGWRVQWGSPADHSILHRRQGDQCLRQQAL